MQPRSILVPLPLVGTGTFFVESLSSYISRLSWFYRVPVWYFIKMLIQSRFETDYVKKEKSIEFIGKKSRSINGSREWARQLILILQELTTIKDLYKATLLTWEDVFPIKGLLDEHKKWCPVCYQEWFDSKSTIYDPLIWFLELIRTCPVHKIDLWDKCPSCLRSQYPLDRYSSPGYCSYCGSWLGKKQVGIGKLLDQDASQDIFIKEIGRLLATNKLELEKPESWRITNFVKEMVATLCEENISGFAKLIKCNRGTVAAWYEGEQNPKLDTLIFMCHMARINLIDILFEDNYFISSSILNMDDFFQTHKGAKKNNWVMIEAELIKANESNIYPPQSLREIGRKIGCDQGQMRKKFPTLCQQIIDRYRLYQKEYTLKNEAKIREEIRDNILKILAQKEYPSINMMRKTLKKPGIMRYKIAIETYYEIMKSLGLR